MNNFPGSTGVAVDRRIVEDIAPQVLLEESLPSGKAYCIVLPENQEKSGFFRTTFKSYAVAVRAQWHAPWTDNQKRYFPAPEPDDALAYSPADHSQPDFSQDDQPFWADEGDTPV